MSPPQGGSPTAIPGTRCYGQVWIPNARFRADAVKVNAPRPLVLIADDDPDILLLLRVRLERSGYEVIAAQDGAEALALAFDRSPDLAILDISIPS